VKFAKPFKTWGPFARKIRELGRQNGISACFSNGFVLFLIEPEPDFAQLPIYLF